MSEITPFDFQGNLVRVVVMEGQPWFVVNDVCSSLGIVDAHRAASRIDDRYLRRAQVTDSVGRLRSTNVVSEPGLYEMIFRSEKPEAVPFRRWVFEDVLPQIRKTGSYSAIPVQPQDDLDILASAIENLREQRRRLTAVEAKVEAIEGNHDWFTTLGYAKLRKLPTDRVSCQRHGQRASRLMKSRGETPVKRQDSTFGEINTYPLTVLDETAE